MKKRIDIMIDEKVLKRFRKMCIEKDFIMSHRVEKLMISDLKRRKK